MTVVTGVACSVCGQRGLPIVCERLECIECCACGYDEAEPAYCPACDEDGMTLVCIDDICRGLGECMHGDLTCDGYAVCPCQTNGGHPISG